MLKKIEKNLQARLWRKGAQNDVPIFQHELAEIVGQDPTSKTVIFPPGLAWQDSLSQRPQHLAAALAKLGCLIFYLEPETSPQPSGFLPQSDSLYLSHVPLEVFTILPDPYIMTMTWNYRYAAQIPNARIIYDFVDELEVFSGNQQKLIEAHSHLLESASIVLATSVQLYEQVEEIRPDVLLCPNGVDYQRFAHKPPEEAEPPADIAHLVRERTPIIGYSGALARWFDYDLLEATVNQRTELHFLLIGPDFDHTLPTSLLGYPNLTWLGSKSYQELPLYIQYFDAAMIPFQVNNITHAVSPLKLFEYMAAGKPVVITPMKESMRYPGVLVAQNHLDFSKQLDEALELRTDQVYLRGMRKVASENTWQMRARQIRQAIIDSSNLSSNRS